MFVHIFFQESKCPTVERRKRAASIMDVTTSIGVRQLFNHFTTTTICHHTNYGNPLFPPKQANMMVHRPKSAVRTAWRKSLCLTPVRSAASTLVQMSLVSPPSCTVAKHLKMSERKDRRTTFNWLEVKDDIPLSSESLAESSRCIQAETFFNPLVLVLLGEEDDSYFDSDEITTRSEFPESWLWLDFVLPNCNPNTPNW